MKDARIPVLPELPTSFSVSIGKFVCSLPLIIIFLIGGHLKESEYFLL